MKTRTIIIFIVLLGFSLGFAQKPKSGVKDETRGTISGQVLDENGSPIEDAPVTIFSIGLREPGSNTTTTTDRKGRFEFENLKPSSYKITVRQIGYVLPEQEIYPSENQTLYKIGDNVTLNLQKGGVITGKALDSEGEPLIQVRVNAVRIRDEFGQKILAKNIDSFSQNNFTDDRGIYRIFGLNAGSYLIYVGGETRFGKQSVKLAESPAVYHPSDPIDTATEVFVDFGRETNLVDISFREMRGFLVSGKISGANPKIGYNGSALISLSHAETAQEIISLSVLQLNGEYSFKLENIPNGEYEIAALQYGDGAFYSKSPTKKITIKDRDVTGININLEVLGSLKGKMTLERNPDLQKLKECRQPSANALTETIFRLTPEADSIESANIISSLFLSNANENGSFEMIGIHKGKYRPKIDFADESLFVDSIYKQISPKEKRDFGRSGFNFGSGENLENVFIRLGDGAAKISGQIEIENISETDRLPTNFSVYLIPAEKDETDNLLRFRKISAEKDGSFVFTNISPGKYFILLKPFNLDLDQIQNTTLPEFWKTESRLSLVEEAKDIGTDLTLDFCRNLTDQKFPYKN